MKEIKKDMINSKYHDLYEQALDKAEKITGVRKIYFLTSLENNPKKSIKYYDEYNIITFWFNDSDASTHIVEKKIK